MLISYGIKEQRRIVSSGGGGGYSPEYQAVYDAFLVTPSDADADAQNTFVTALVDGDIWSELDRLFILASHASGVDSVLDWMNPTVSGNIGTLVNNPTFTLKQGYGSALANVYINLNYNPSSDGVKLSLNNVSWGLKKTGVGDGHLGAFVGTSFLGTTSKSLLTNSSFDGGIFPDDPTEVTSGERENATAHNAYVDGIGVAGNPITHASNGIPNLDLYVILFNSNGSPSGAPREDAIYNIVWFGGFLGATKQLIIRNAFETLYNYYNP